jgi:hypothetical protein
VFFLISKRKLVGSYPPRRTQVRVLFPLLSKTPLQQVVFFFISKRKLVGSYPPRRTQVRVFAAANYQGKASEKSEVFLFYPPLFFINIPLHSRAEGRDVPTKTF